jgi:Icc-related predicted phosphoesterase
MKSTHLIILSLLIIIVIGIIGLEVFIIWFNPTLPSIIKQYLTTPISSSSTCSSPLNVHKVTSQDANHLFHFVQLSDIHLSHTKRREYRLENFKKVAFEILPKIILPRFVIVTGDLTHASYPKLKESEEDRNWLERRINLNRPQQNIEEWKSYSTVAKEGNELLSRLVDSHSMISLSLLTQNDTKLPLKDIVWFDCPGNHDRFNVPVLSDHSMNYYTDYSCCLSMNDKSKSGNRTFAFTVDTHFGSYEFIGIDATPEHGGFAPFNFFGLFKQNGMDELEQKLIKSHENKRNATVVFGHYPQSTVHFDRTSSGLSIQQLSQKYPYTAYLSGHLHNIYNLVWNLKAKAPTILGHYEWEIPDFKEHNIIRVLAIDHDTISYGDLPFDKWPRVLVTSPASMNCQCKQVLDEIRLLIFSPERITDLQITIDGQTNEMISNHTEQALLDHRKSRDTLFRIKYDPLQYSSGTHHLRLTVRDAANNSRSFDHEFALDGSNCHYQTTSNLLTRFILFTNFQLLFPSSFYICMALGIITLTLLKLLLNKPVNNNDSFSLKNGLASVIHSRYYYFFIGYLLYLPIFPWFAGEIATGEYALFFEWGIYYLGYGRIERKAVVTPDIHFYITVFVLYWLFASLFALLIFNRSFPRNKQSTKYTVTQGIVMVVYLYILYKRFMRFYLVIVRTYGQYALLFSPCGIWLFTFIFLIYCYEFNQMIRRNRTTKDKQE